jgi:3-oxoacyl-[acyl-carrier protein] reductase
MEFNLAGKTAIVAAASRGIGRAVAQGLAAEGVNLAICARNEPELLTAARQIQSANHVDVLPILADVTKGPDVTDLVLKTSQRFQRIDILVTNAGGPPPGSFESFDDTAWQNAITLNLLSTVRLCREVIPYMKRQQWGRIVNLVSIAAKQPLEGLVLSNSVRAGVIGLAKTLSQEMATYNILVNSICPGWILTERLTSIIEKRSRNRGASYEDELAEVTSDIPLGRCGTVEEIANLAVFLASDRASYITGTTIQVDGGLTKGLL